MDCRRVKAEDTCPGVAFENTKIDNDHITFWTTISEDEVSTNDWDSIICWAKAAELKGDVTGRMVVQ